MPKCQPQTHSGGIPHQGEHDAIWAPATKSEETSWDICTNEHVADYAIDYMVPLESAGTHPIG